MENSFIDEHFERSVKNDFINFYFNMFRTSNEYIVMNACVENTEWHRERSVAVHTDMVISQYMSLPFKGNIKMWLVGALACAFHDTGKLSAEKKIEKNGKKYNSYAGHELKSARIWENFAVKHFDYLQSVFGFFDVDVIMMVAWIIEHHLPFTVVKDYKVQALVETNHRFGGVLTNCIKADCFGRDSDDHDKKIFNTLKWCDEFDKKPLSNEHQHDGIGKKLFMLIGVCGSGKSTYRSAFVEKNPDTLVFCLDDLRELLYSEEHERGTREGYDKAFKASCENEKEFKSEMFTRYVEMLRTGKNIIADNMNLSAKQRRSFLIEARKKGYMCFAITFPIDYDTLLDRQISRPDKTVPIDVVYRSYYSLQQPSYYEFDDIFVLKSESELLHP